MIITHCPECTILSSTNESSSSLEAESSQQVTSIGSSSVELSVSSTLSLVESTASSDCLESTTFTSIVSTTTESIYTITSNESTFEMTTTVTNIDPIVITTCPTITPVSSSYSSSESSSSSVLTLLLTESDSTILQSTVSTDKSSLTNDNQISTVSTETPLTSITIIETTSKQQNHYIQQHQMILHKFSLQL